MPTRRDSKTTSNIFALSKAASQLSRAVGSGKLKMTYIGRSAVFRDRGSACCVIGHVIQAAGLKKQMGAFRGPSFDGNPGAKWWDSVAAMTHLCGPLRPEVVKAIGELQVINDCWTGADRRRGISAGLGELCAALELMK